MASEAIIALEDLLAPVSEDNPAGNDIREDASPSSPYYAIKDARNAARAAERSNLFDDSSSAADEHWREIIRLAPGILQNNAKDLEVACWFTEALLRNAGFQGLRDGFQLILGLVENYWDNLFPLPDEDGIETRVAPLTGLNGEGAEGVLIAPIRKVLITQGQEPGPFSFWHYQQALEIEKVIDEEARLAKAAKLGFARSDIEQAVSESSEAFYADLYDDIDQAIGLYRQIGQLLDEHCGINDSPPTSNIINVLEDTLGTIKFIAKHKLPSAEPDANVDAGEPGGTNMNDSSLENAPAAIVAGPVKSREQAFRQLAEISAFFRKTEPHSPISYIIERAVKWGDLPLEELIKELIPDSSARDTYGSLTGVKTEEEY